MASPNIVGINTVVGFTTVYSNVSTSEVVLLNSPLSTNSVYKLNNIICCNTTASSANITVSFRSAASGTGTAHKLANATPVAAYSTLVVLDKASALYLEENKSITVLSSAVNAFDVVASYELIS
jgi:hypothetical protein